MRKACGLSLLSVSKGHIVDGAGRRVGLRGTCIGGWMNTENFINGYPGCDRGLRMVLAEVLGPGKARFFVDRMMDHFLGEADLAFLKSCGCTAVRLPLNYRHFESDARPFKYIEAGFERLDRLLKACDRHGIYAILDLHAVQGWQNPDWHCDNGNRISLFWTTPHFQDRFVALWAELARRYRGWSVVAGYNVMNEPVTNGPRGRFHNRYVTDWDVINRVYRRVVEGIREEDPHHIIFLEGDLYSTRFEKMEKPFAPDLVYSSHNYNTAGFGPGAYPGPMGGGLWDRRRQEQVFAEHEGTTFARRHGVPLWVGEFGSVYNGPAAEIPDRLRALDDQIAVYNRHGVHWTTWTYKDVGVMGWVMVDPESEYLQRVKGVLDAKRELCSDAWMGWLPRTTTRGIYRGLAEHMERAVDDREFPVGQFEGFLSQTMSDFTGGLLQWKYAKAFKGLSERELDRVLESFAFKRCRVTRGLIDVVRKHLK